MKDLSRIFSRLVRQLLIAVIAFEGVVIGGVALFMTVGMLVGYLPYSDRPGPGWYGPSETIQSVNLRQGYPMIEIRTPREVLSDE